MSPRVGYSCGIYNRNGSWVIKVASGYLVCEPDLKFSAVADPSEASQFVSFTQAASTAALVQRITSKEVTIEPHDRQEK